MNFSANRPPLAIVSAPGTLGDVHPMLGIALQLQARGYRTVMLLAGSYLPLAQRAGLEAHPIISAERFEAMLRQKEVWKPIRGARLLLAAAAEFLPDHYRWLERHAEPGRTLLIHHPLDFAARIYRDRFPATPLLSVHLAPGTIRCFDPPPRMTGWWFEARRPSWLVAASYYAVDRLVVDRILTPAINHLRASLGLVAVDRPLHTWWFSPDGVAGLFPEWFGPTSAAWPKQFRALGFPLIDHSRAHTDTHGSTPSTEATLLDRPIVFTAGSGNLHAREFFRSAVAVCGQSNQPAVMLCREREQLPLTLPRRVIHLPYSPLSELLPRASAIVHHGGIGTTSQGFAAGLPQWVFPFAYDQFDNATRVRRLGVGDWTPSARVSTAAMQRAVTALQDRSDWRRTARGLADRLADQPDASAAAADWIVAMARERGIADPKPPATGSSSADER